MKVHDLRFFPILCYPNTTVDELRLRLAEELNEPIYKIRLVGGGKVLQDGQRISDVLPDLKNRLLTIAVIITSSVDSLALVS